MIAEVIVDIATSETDRIYDYRCPDGLSVGSRVSAPFGGKTVSGFIGNLKEKSTLDSARLNDVTPFPDGLPALNGECLTLAKKISARYRVPLALSLRLFLPSEMRTGKVRELTRVFVELLDGCDETGLKKTAKNQLGTLANL